MDWSRSYQLEESILEIQHLESFKEAKLNTFNHGVKTKTRISQSYYFSVKVNVVSTHLKCLIEMFPVYNSKCFCKEIKKYI